MTSSKLSQTVRGRSAMIDHVTIRVSNIERAKEFYAKTLLPLGYSLQYEDNYFGAFAIDPDGNNIEAVCHKSEN